MAISIDGFKTYSQWQNADGDTGITARLVYNSVSDALIQNHLDAAKAQIRTMCGFTADDDDPEDVRFDHAVYCQSLYAIEQTSSQRITKEMNLNDIIKERRSHFPRDSVLREAIHRKILSLIHPFRKNLRFMPDVPGQVD